MGEMLGCQFESSGVSLTAPLVPFKNGVITSLSGIPSESLSQLWKHLYILTENIYFPSVWSRGTTVTHCPLSSGHQITEPSWTAVSSLGDPRLDSIPSCIFWRWLTSGSFRFWCHWANIYESDFLTSQTPGWCMWFTNTVLIIHLSCWLTAVFPSSFSSCHTRACFVIRSGSTRFWLIWR